MKRLALSVLSVAAALSLAAKGGQARPRLVVGIVVDQLRTDYIEYLRDYFGEKGFKALLADGVYMRDVDFKTSRLDATSATALLYTGAYPFETGVPSANIYEVKQSRVTHRPPLTPADALSISNDSFTPTGLRLSTIADELVIDAAGAAKIYSVAIDPQQAVIMAGHAGTGAIWLNNSSGNWASSSYYNAIPSSVYSRNLSRSLASRIDTMVWTPSASFNKVEGISQKRRISPFRHSFSQRDRDVYLRFANSPFANREVTDVAIDLINNLNLGNTPGETDMLNVAYSLAPFKYSSSGAVNAELIDAYLRLDGQLARLISAVDKSVGAQNVIIWLSSTGHYDDPNLDDSKYKIPTGVFSTKRARSLLNSYLSARFGAASYVLEFRDDQVFFDRKVLENTRINTADVLAEARSFLIKMSGVADAYTIDDVISSASEACRDIRLGVDLQYCGDIFLHFSPGWRVAYDEQLPVQERVVRHASILTPAFIRAPGVAPTRINTTVEAVRIAPTLTNTLHIRAPNGATHKALPLDEK